MSIRKQTQEQIRLLARHGIKVRPFDEVFKAFSKSKGFREAYREETARLDLAKRLRGLRMEKRMTQKAVAEKAGMPQSIIARIESGDRGVSVETLGKVAHAFGKEIQLV